MIYVKINDTLYQATITGKITDKEWDNRESKSITLKGTYDNVNSLFSDGVTWSIVQENTVPVTDEQGNPVLNENEEPTYQVNQTEFDNSDFNIRGDLIIHVDGTCTVKMGKPTDLEEAYEIMYGGM